MEGLLLVEGDVAHYERWQGQWVDDADSGAIMALLLHGLRRARFRQFLDSETALTLDTSLAYGVCREFAIIPAALGVCCGPAWGTSQAKRSAALRAGATRQLRTAGFR